jgi:hypothetical protein
MSTSHLLDLGVIADGIRLKFGFLFCHAKLKKAG